MTDTDNLHETSTKQTLDKATRSRGRPAYAEKDKESLNVLFAVEVMKGVLASGVAVEDPLALSRHCYKIADALVKVRDE